MSRGPLRRFLDRALTGEANNLIAEGVVVDGFVKGIGHLVVAGRVKGDCKLAGTVTLADSGSWQGRIEAERILIAGELDGSAEASDKLEIGATARITGDVAARRIAVAQGAIVEGKMLVSGEEPPVTFEEKRTREDED